MLIGSYTHSCQNPKQRRSVSWGRKRCVFAAGQECQSNTGSEEHLETPILQYAGGVIAAKLDRTEKELVHGVSFHISRGESLALIGETGSGKTLIAQSVMGVLPGNVRLVSGEVLFCGKALPKGKKAAVHAGPGDRIYPAERSRIS